MNLAALAWLSGTLLLALGASYYLDWATRDRPYFPPGFKASLVRRRAGMLAVAAVLWIGVFLPLGVIGSGVKVEPDPSEHSTPGLFFLHFLLLLTLGIWFLLGFAGRAGAEVPRVRFATPGLPPEFASPSAATLPLGAEEATDAEPILFDAERSAPHGEPEAAQQAPPPSPQEATIPVVPLSLVRRFAQQFGLVAPSVPVELGYGLGIGFAAWAGVLAVLVVVAVVLAASGQTELGPKELPAMIPWLASRSVLLRLSISLSAGFVEELFFRGFLQPRVGILLSSALFTLAHLSYGQPFMLIGIALLSLIYGLLVRWRQSIWAAVAAHSLFDGIQLLILVPGVVKLLGGQAKGAGTALLTLLGLC